VFFLDGKFMFTVSDLTSKKGKIGLYADGKREFDNLKVWT
jgi:hypothetical protein